MAPRCKHQHLTHRFSPGSKLFFGTVVGWLTCWVMSYGSCDMDNGVSTPRRGASCSVPRNHPTPAPDSPTRRQAAEVKMVGCITISPRHSTAAQEKWRHFACTSAVIIFCTSLFCAGVPCGVMCWGACPRCVRKCSEMVRKKRTNPEERPSGETGESSHQPIERVLVISG